MPGMVNDGSDFQKVAMTEHELLIVWEIFCRSPKHMVLNWWWFPEAGMNLEKTDEQAWFCFSKTLN